MSIDERIDSAGATLAGTPVEVPSIERLLRRYRRRVRAAASCSALAVIAIGVIALVSSKSSDQSTIEPGDSVAIDAFGRDYELTVEGARPLPVEALTARSTDTAVWVDEATDTYLTLVVRPGVAPSSRAPTGLGAMVEDASFPTDQGRAWFTDTTDSSVRHLTMWWSRPNADLWLLSSFWYGPDPVNTIDGRRSLRDQALAITAQGQLGKPQDYRLADPSMRALAMDHGGDVESRAQVWNYDVGSAVGKITLLSIKDTAAAGRANLLARGDPDEVQVDGHDAWQVTDSSTGEIQIGWQTDDDGPVWRTLTIPANLASLAPQIRAALETR